MTTKEPWTWKKRKRDENENEEVVNKYSKVEHISSSTIECHLSPYCSSLKEMTIAEYEEHYHQQHENVCSQCNRILPTKHILHLHLLEVHDSYFKVLAEREHSYECFVDDCTRKSQTPKSRIRHLIQIHKYPGSFEFDVVKGVAVKKTKKLISKPTINTSDEQNDAMKLDELTDKMSNLFIPRSIRFGHKQPKSIIH